MNDDARRLFVAFLRSWGLGGGGVILASDRFEAMEPVRRPLCVCAIRSGDACRVGRRYYVDPPAAVQPAETARVAVRNGRISIGASESGITFERSPWRRDETLLSQRMNRLGSLVRRLLTVRNRRISRRLSGAYKNSNHTSSAGYERAGGRGCVELWIGGDGEAASVEPP